jgi:drug/metabolite transporter (DMT)-like permease
MVWAHYWINEAITPTFWIAMLLVMAGVLLGQIKWNRPSWLRGT